MKTLRKYNIKGFSLIELMVVVAIIGILSAIAIPNFQRFQRKARQSEAKTALGGLYTAEKAFIAEWESYNSDFDAIGFSIDGNLRYNTGFPAGGTPCALVNGAAACAAAAGIYTGVTGSGEATTTVACGSSLPDCIDGSAGLLPATAANPAIAGVNTHTFVAGSSGLIGGPQEDQWTIDQAKSLLNPQSGL